MPIKFFINWKVSLIKIQKYKLQDQNKNKYIL
jgi:hypothetical protein